MTALRHGTGTWLRCGFPRIGHGTVATILWLALGCDRIRDEVAVTNPLGSAGGGGRPATGSAEAAGTSASILGEYLTSVRFTYWSFELEADFSGSDDTVLNDQSCAPIANVPADFAGSLCAWGSGRLTEGPVVNFDGTCRCGYPCPQDGSTVCFVLVDYAQFPWGVGAANTPIVPLRSLTIDESVILHGSVLYAPIWDGLAIPAQSGVGGFVHDGCFRADDAGYGITGSTVSLAAGPIAMYSWLTANTPTGGNTWKVYLNTPHCSYLALP